RGDCACGRPAAADGRGLARGEQPRPAARRRAAKRPAQSSDRTGLSRGRRTRSDAAPAAEGLLDTHPMTTNGQTLDAQPQAWASSTRRHTLRRLLHDRDGVDPDDVIMPPDLATRRGMTSTVCFPNGNLAPEGAVIKSTSIDPSVIDADGVYRLTGTARVFVTE